MPRKVIVFNAEFNKTKEGAHLQTWSGQTTELDAKGRQVFLPGLLDQLKQRFEHVYIIQMFPPGAQPDQASQAYVQGLASKDNVGVQLFENPQAFMGASSKGNIQLKDANAVALAYAASETQLNMNMMLRAILKAAGVQIPVVNSSSLFNLTSSAAILSQFLPKNSALQPSTALIDLGLGAQAYGEICKTVKAWPEANIMCSFVHAERDNATVHIPKEQLGELCIVLNLPMTLFKKQIARLGLGLEQQMELVKIKREFLLNKHSTMIVRGVHSGNLLQATGMWVCDEKALRLDWLQAPEVTLGKNVTADVAGQIRSLLLKDGEDMKRLFLLDGGDFIATLYQGEAHIRNYFSAVMANQLELISLTKNFRQFVQKNPKAMSTWIMRHTYFALMSWQLSGDTAALKEHINLYLKVALYLEQLSSNQIDQVMGTHMLPMQDILFVLKLMGLLEPVRFNSVITKFNGEREAALAQHRDLMKATQVKLDVIDEFFTSLQRTAPSNIPNYVSTAARNTKYNVFVRYFTREGSESSLLAQIQAALSGLDCTVENLDFRLLYLSTVTKTDDFIGTFFKVTQHSVPCTFQQHKSGAISIYTKEAGRALQARLLMAFRDSVKEALLAEDAPGLDPKEAVIGVLDSIKQDQAALQREFFRKDCYDTVQEPDRMRALSQKVHSLVMRLKQLVASAEQGADSTNSPLRALLMRSEQIVAEHLVKLCQVRVHKVENRMNVEIVPLALPVDILEAFQYLDMTARPGIDGTMMIPLRMLLSTDDLVDTEVDASKEIKTNFYTAFSDCIAARFALENFVQEAESLLQPRPQATSAGPSHQSSRR